jgi:hypothetical protein
VYVMPIDRISAEIASAMYRIDSGSKGHLPKDTARGDEKCAW